MPSWQDRNTAGGRTPSRNEANSGSATRPRCRTPARHPGRGRIAAIGRSRGEEPTSGATAGGV
jgi:hypothetical protein